MLETMELVSIIGVNVAVIGAVLGSSYKIFLAIDKVRSEGEDKRSRIYERLDVVKKEAENRFSSKEVCMVLHKQIDAKLSEISSDVKMLLKNGNHKDEKD